MYRGAQRAQALCLAAPGLAACQADLGVVFLAVGQCPVDMMRASVDS